jgi:hypothetical protein
MTPEQYQEILDKNAKACLKKQRTSELPFPLPDKYKNDGDSRLPRDALKAVSDYRLLLRRFGPDRDEDEDQLKRATDVARGIRLAWSDEWDLELAEVPLAKDFKRPTDEDFARLEQWLLTAANATKKETAKYEAAAGNSQDGGKSSTATERASAIAKKVDSLFVRNRSYFLSNVETFKQEYAARKEREKDAEKVSDEADRAILDELDAIKAGNATPSLTDKQKRHGPGWEWQAVFPGDKDGDPVPHMVEGWIPPAAVQAEAVLAKKHDYEPGPNPTAATMVTLLAALHDNRLPNSPAILDPASGETLSAVQDPGLFALYGARMWCIGARKGNTDRLDALETYLNHAEAAIAEVQTAKPETTTPAAKTPEERARQIALEVDGLYHGNPARWQEQWAAAVAEAVGGEELLRRVENSRGGGFAPATLFPVVTHCSVGAPVHPRVIATSLAGSFSAVRRDGTTLMSNDRGSAAAEDAPSARSPRPRPSRRATPR